MVYIHRVKPTPQGNNSPRPGGAGAGQWSATSVEEEDEDLEGETPVTRQPRSRLFRRDGGETSGTGRGAARRAGVGETSLTEPILCLTEEDVPMPKVFHRLSAVHLHHEWMAESYGSGSYRYLHYTVYGSDGLKVLDAQIETAYDTQMAWCLRCWPRAVRVRVADASGCDVLIIELTGRLGAHPIDTADLRLSCGHRFATLRWNMPWFEVYDLEEERLMVMKWPRCIICSLSGDYTIMAGDGKTPLGTIDASYSLMGPQWKGEEVLHSILPERLDPRLKAAWVALMLMLRLGCGGRQHAKVVSE